MAIAILLVALWGDTRHNKWVIPRRVEGRAKAAVEVMEGAEVDGVMDMEPEECLENMPGLSFESPPSDFSVGTTPRDYDRLSSDGVLFGSVGPRTPRGSFLGLGEEEPGVPMFGRAGLPPRMAKPLRRPIFDLSKTPPEVGTMFKRVKRDRSVQFCAAVANMVKADIGLPKPTEANLLMVAKAITAKLTKLNVRNADKARYMPHIRGLVFTPTESDIAEAQHYKTLHVRQAAERYSGPWEQGKPGRWNPLRLFARPLPGQDHPGIVFKK